MHSYYNKDNETQRLASISVVLIEDPEPERSYAPRAHLGNGEPAEAEFLPTSQRRIEVEIGGHVVAIEYQPATLSFAQPEPEPLPAARRRSTWGY